MSETSTQKSPPSQDEDFLEAREFWLKCIFNPEFLKFGVSFHACMFLAAGAVVRSMYGTSFDTPGLHKVPLFLGGLSVFCSVFSILVVATMARDMEEQKTLTPKGFDGLSIAGLAASIITFGISGLINLIW